MDRFVKIGKYNVGDLSHCFIIAEIGINHNGDINLAKRLVKLAKDNGCDAVKFQKRTVELVYSKHELEMERPNPFGNTNGDLKRGLEFSYEQYQEIDKYCREHDILWFASCWDKNSVDFIDSFNPPCHKIASASLTDDELILHIKSKGRPILLATGMSTQDEIDHALSILGMDNLVLMHCTSTYPSLESELNLNVIPNYIKRYSCPIGYSGHEKGVLPSVIAASMGACAIERHITTDRTLWGSDHPASLEPEGLRRLVRDIRLLNTIKGDGKKVVYESELPIIKKLRKVKNNA
ncbi:TPA: N-acetylneuraminate synthase family protein [Candidatus Galligastranaerophilus intestinavium]|uniref:N-acetylneuraminate synthase family protein n=1 Tax=Candidatus Galligastranaerophilus intestinavium TaxID=2840836 RepID=A0A9D1JXN4_9BACT|nr:N-acetylneuraminate synthase family protein [Candidatus Galligastranaerophilus intestinavium]